MARSRRPSLLLLGVVALAGCSRVGGDATQVAAKVNDTEISLSQLQHLMQRQPAVAPEHADAQARRVLDAVLDQELAAQGARKMGLDKEPRVVQAIEAARREVLARSYHDVLAEKTPLPASDDIDRYYDSQPALFAQRRFYAMQETLVQGDHAELAALQTAVQMTPNAARMAEVLREARLRSTSRQMTISPEDVPLPLLAKLADLREGHSLMVPAPGGARVLTLLSSTPAPLSREAARNAIQSFLTNERKRQTVQQGMKSLRDAAQIEYKGKFALVAAEPASGAQPAESAASAAQAR